MSVTIGIDLGTSNSCVAIMEGGQVNPPASTGWSFCGPVAPNPATDCLRQYLHFFDLL